MRLQLYNNISDDRELFLPKPGTSSKWWDFSTDNLVNSSGTAFTRQTLIDFFRQNTGFSLAGLTSASPTVIEPVFTNSTNSDSYDAFGQVVYVSERNEIHSFYMQGTSHINDGKIMHRVFDLDNNTWGPESILYTPPSGFHYIGVSAGKLNGKLWVFFSRFDPDAGIQGEHDLLHYASSTDLSGSSWSSLQQFNFPSITEMPRHNFYGKMVYGENALTAYVFWLQHELPVLNAKIRAIKTIDGGNIWTDIQIHEASSAGDVLTEFDAVKVSPNKFVGLVRNEQGKKLYASLTTTGVENFPDFSITNLGFDNLNGQFPMVINANDIARGSVAHSKMAATAYDDESDEAIAIYLDRSVGNIYLSKTPISQLESDPSDWNAPIFYYDNRPNESLIYYTSFRGGLGYPSITWTGRRISGKKEWMVIFGQESEKSGKCDLVYTLDNFSAYPSIEVLFPVETFDLNVNANDMELSWSSVTGADQYEVWRTDNYYDSETEGNWQMIQTTSSLSYMDAINPLDRFWYKVRAIGANKHPSIFSVVRYGSGNGTPVQTVQFTEALRLTDGLSGTLASTIIANNIGTGDFTFITVMDGTANMAASGGNSFIGFLNGSYLFNIQTNSDVRHFVNGSLRYNTNNNFPTDIQMMIVRRESGTVKIQYNDSEVFNQVVSATDATGQTFNFLPNPVPDGRIFMFGVWDRSLTDSEVANTVNNNNLLKPQQSIIDNQCLALYYFETSGAIVNGSNLELQDQSGSGNHININGITGIDGATKKIRYDLLIETIN